MKGLNEIQDDNRIHAEAELQSRRDHRKPIIFEPFENDALQEAREQVSWQLSGKPIDGATLEVKKLELVVGPEIWSTVVKLDGMAIMCTRFTLDYNAAGACLLTLEGISPRSKKDRYTPRQQWRLHGYFIGGPGGKIELDYAAQRWVSDPEEVDERADA